MTQRTLLRGLAKLVAVLAAAAIGGLAIGTALAKLSGDDKSPTDVTRGPPGAAAASATTDAATATPRQRPAGEARVRIVSAILHPGTSPSSKRRQRARLSVHVRVTNGGSRRFVATRPVLVSGGVRIRTDASQDTAATNLGALAPGATGDVTLRFETAGAVTERLRRELRVRLVIAGRTVSAGVKLGRDVGGAAPKPKRPPARTGTTPPPPPPPVAPQRSAAPPRPAAPPPRPPPPPPAPAKTSPSSGPKFDSSG